MANYLKMPTKQQVLALLALGWSYRRIEAETGVRRETVSGYDQQRLANPAKPFAGSRRFTAAAYHDTICENFEARLSVQRIWQDLVEDFGYGASYESIKRYREGEPHLQRCVRRIDTPGGPRRLRASSAASQGPWASRRRLGPLT